jgi:hypothetical protein
MRARHPVRRLLTCFALAAASLLLVPAEQQADAGTASWVFIDKEQGISVSQRDEANRQFPTFKGVGKVNASIYDVLAVILDADDHDKWMHDCAGSRKIKQLSDHQMIVWNQTDAPWPVKDRDVVLMGTLEVVTPGREIISRFEVTSKAKVPKGSNVIRMPRLEGHWKLTALRNGTQVEYQVNADPAGKLPDWLVERTARDIPMYTLAGLRKRVNKTRGSYDAEVARYKSIGY